MNKTHVKRILSYATLFVNSGITLEYFIRVKEAQNMGGQYLKDALAKNIKLYRLHHELSQADLAEKANVSVNFISDLERGTRWPRADTIARISQALSVPASDLFKEENAATDGGKDIMIQFSNDMSRTIVKAMGTVQERYAAYLSHEPTELS
jgi:transcriptional regulator with XRE-family HTH domain